MPTAFTALAATGAAFGYSACPNRAYAGIRTYSLPSVGRTEADGSRVAPHIEFGIKAEGAACTLLDQAWEEVLRELGALGGEMREITQE